MTIDLRKTLFLLLSAPLAFGACGGDDDKASPDADTTVLIDAGEPDPDAAPDTTFSGTVSLAEIAITNPGFETVSGAVVNIGFTNPADVTQEPEPGYTTNVGACRIFVYDVAGGDSAASGSEGGPVTVAGTNGSNAASFDCNYSAAADTYLCSSGDGAASGDMLMADTALTVLGAGAVNLTIPAADFSNENYVGMQIVLSGFINADANGRFGIIGQPNATTLTLAIPDLLEDTTLSADSTYQTLIGAGPVPGGFDFLDDGTADVTITKAAITDVPAINTTLKVNGSGFTLDSASTLPHAVPLDGSAATFSCAGPTSAPVAGDGDCGSANGFLKGIIVFGETTDGVVDPTDPTDMPEPVSSYATFQCSGIGAESITLDAGAMALITGTNPTRIQTSVTYANAQLSGENTIVMSHGVLGFTSPTAE